MTSRHQSLATARDSRIGSILDVDAKPAPYSDRRPSHSRPVVAVTTGLRYTHERKTIDNAGGDYSIDSPTTLVSGSYCVYRCHLARCVDAEVRRRAACPRERDGVWSATRGFKSGGFNPTSPEAGRGFAPEWAWSYEGGLKTVPPADGPC